MQIAKIMWVGGAVAAAGISLAAVALVWQNQQVARQWAEEKALADQVAAKQDAAQQAQLAAAVAELGMALQAQQVALHAAKEQNLKSLQNDMIRLSDALEDVGNHPPPVVRLSAEQMANLPKFFEDALVMPAVEKDYEDERWNGKVQMRHFSFKGMKVPFKMILVPGDPAKGIAPFYMGETEVGWDLFKPWSHWYDVTVLEAVKEVSEGLRPSNADSYSDTSHNGKRYDGYPALGMSRLNAEKFCEMLSKRTGRKYRLPTEAEWDCAYAWGGGDPVDKLACAWCAENSYDYLRRDDFRQDDPMSYELSVGKIATKKPNKLGLYDMLGNVAEWVKTPGTADVDGKNTFVRGGDYTTPMAELTGERREESDGRMFVKGSWNQNYPNNPTSKWWYLDHYQIGFRLVCEPVNLPSPK